MKDFVNRLGLDILKGRLSYNFSPYTHLFFTIRLHFVEKYIYLR